jgi:hypothetical protein
MAVEKRKSQRTSVRKTMNLPGFAQEHALQVLWEMLPALGLLSDLRTPDVLSLAEPDKCLATAFVAIAGPAVDSATCAQIPHL